MRYLNPSIVHSKAFERCTLLVDLRDGFYDPLCTWSFYDTCSTP